jgi:integrase
LPAPPPVECPDRDVAVHRGRARDGLPRMARAQCAPRRRAARARVDGDAVERSTRRPGRGPGAGAHPRTPDPSSSTRGRRREVHQGAAIPSRSARQRVLPLVLAMADGKEPGDLLFTTDGGSPLHRTATLRAVDSPKTNPGRRIHDLRHTAACLWLAGGVDPGAVQAWMGHESIATRTCTCTSSAHVPTEPVWRDSTCPGGRRGPSQSPIGGLPR